jgi:excisionase family DNA binding protein
MEKLLTVKELAAVLGVTPTCVYRWLGEKKLTAVRFSKRCVRFRESDVQELLQQLTDAGANAPVHEQLYRKVLEKQRQR